MYIETMPFEMFWNELSVWSQKTFGSDKDRGPQGPLKHLAKEVQECLDNPTDLEEYADLVFLAFDSCRRAGFTVDELKSAITTKMIKNVNRKWGPPSSDAPVEHIRDNE